MKKTKTGSLIDDTAVSAGKGLNDNKIPQEIENHS